MISIEFLAKFLRYLEIIILLASSTRNNNVINILLLKADRQVQDAVFGEFEIMLSTAADKQTEIVN